MPAIAKQIDDTIKVTVAGSGPANTELELTFNGTVVSTTHPSPHKTDAIANYTYNFTTQNHGRVAANIDVREKYTYVTVAGQ